jgi:carbamate kinase
MSSFIRRNRNTLDWQESVLDKDLTEKQVPGAPDNGDRYIIKTAVLTFLDPVLDKDISAGLTWLEAVIDKDLSAPPTVKV